MVVPSHSVMRGANEDESCFAAIVRILVFGEFSSCQTVRDSYVRESPAGGSKLINCVNKPQSGIHALTHQFNVRKRGASKCTSTSSPHPPRKKAPACFLLMRMFSIREPCCFPTAASLATNPRTTLKNVGDTRENSRWANLTKTLSRLKFDVIFRESMRTCQANRQQ